MVTKDLLRQCGAAEGEKLPAYAWPGGYPLVYFSDDNAILCPDCANADAQDDYRTVTACDVHWEGDPIVCDDCGNEIESAYGPVD